MVDYAKRRAAAKKSAATSKSTRASQLAGVTPVELPFEVVSNDAEVATAGPSIPATDLTLVVQQQGFGTVISPRPKKTVDLKRKGPAPLLEKEVDPSLQKKSKRTPDVVATGAAGSSAVILIEEDNVKEGTPGSDLPHLDPAFLADSSSPNWGKKVSASLRKVPRLGEVLKKEWETDARAAIGEGLLVRVCDPEDLSFHHDPLFHASELVGKFGLAVSELSTHMLNMYSSAKLHDGVLRERLDTEQKMVAEIEELRREKKEAAAAQKQIKALQGELSSVKLVADQVFDLKRREEESAQKIAGLSDQVATLSKEKKELEKEYNYRGVKIEALTKERDDARATIDKSRALWEQGSEIVEHLKDKALQLREELVAKEPPRGSTLFDK